DCHRHAGAVPGHGSARHVALEPERGAGALSGRAVHSAAGPRILRTAAPTGRRLPRPGRSPGGGYRTAAVAAIDRLAAPRRPTPAIPWRAGHRLRWPDRRRSGPAGAPAAADPEPGGGGPAVAAGGERQWQVDLPACPAGLFAL